MGGGLREWEWRVHEGATEGCANGSSSTGMTNSAPGVGDKHSHVRGQHGCFIPAWSLGMAYE